MVDPAGEGAPEELDQHECWALLRQAEVGRLALVLAGAPAIFPVNFLVDQGSVVVRTGPGSKLAAALAGGPVAFEVDGYDGSLGEAWSVVLQGSVDQVRRTEDLLQTVSLPLFPWHATPKPVFLRLEPHTVTGRRFRVVPPSTWDMPLSRTRPAAYE